jgi:hypothetical protein
MDSKEYAKLVAYLKEEFAKKPEFSAKFASWLNEKDRQLVLEIARSAPSATASIIEFQAGKAAMRLDIRQTFLPKEIQDGRE